MINLDKKTQPKYLYRLHVALVVFFALWFTVGVAAAVAVGCVYGEAVVTYAVMGAIFALFFVVLALYLFLEHAFRGRFISECAALLEAEFCEMPPEQAERVLKERGDIDGEAFIMKGDGVFEGMKVPYSQAAFAIDAFCSGTKIELSLVLYTAGSNVPKEAYDFDRAAYNFLIYKNFGIVKNESFKLLMKNKTAFAKSVLKQTKTITL